MTEAEVSEMDQNPNIQDIVQVRLYDDQGKVARLKTPAFAHYAPMVQRVVDAHLGAS